MIIMGIDPGYATIGCGIISYDKSRFKTLYYDAITTPPKMDFAKRLVMIYDALCALIEKYSPDVMAVEELFFTTNQKTAIFVAQARGVILLSAAKNNIESFEYTPLQVKQAVVGYGKAEKSQVMDLTRRILSLDSVPKPDDVADALAIAICHAHSSGRTARIPASYGKDRTLK